jgi:type IV pilus assembly protein PilN
MYSLDVNFLKDREPQQVTGPAPPPVPAGSMTPLIIGIILGLVPLGLVGGFWLFLTQQNARLEEQKAQLDGQLGALKQSEQQIKQLTDQTNQVRSETQALATVFNRIKPWSAMLQDIRERTPPAVIISSIEQKPGVATAPPPAPTNAAPGQTPPPPPESPPAQLVIQGAARSFDDVNYLLLTLQRSSFLKGEETQLIKAQLEENPIKLEVERPQAQNRAATRVTYTLPKFVKYQIQTTLSDVPASELIRELDRKGAVGLVTRIRTLQEKGVIQK